MPIIEFSSIKPIQPLFGVKLPVIFCRMLSKLPATQVEGMIRESMIIKKSRLIHIETAEFTPNESTMILVIFDYLIKKAPPQFEIPIEDGYYSFPIYDLNFNIEIDIEKLVTVTKKRV